jgi:hypothetical protein
MKKKSYQLVTAKNIMTSTSTSSRSFRSVISCDATFAAPALDLFLNSGPFKTQTSAPNWTTLTQLTPFKIIILAGNETLSPCLDEHRSRDLVISIICSFLAIAFQNHVHHQDMLGESKQCEKVP